MAPDPLAADVFKEQLEDADNHSCCDCGAREAVWASITHGIYLSIGAAGVHRSLGVQVSRVQSITMDSWKPIHLKMMQLGGNRKFNDFLKNHSIPEDMPIRQKYNTRAVEWYRRNLRALAEGLEPLAPLRAGTGHLPFVSCPTPEMKKLDAVFAKIPSSKTAGGYEKDGHEDSSCARSLCESLSAWFRVRHHGVHIMESREDFKCEDVIKVSNDSLADRNSSLKLLIEN